MLALTIYKHMGFILHTFYRIATVAAITALAIPFLAFAQTPEAATLSTESSEDGKLELEQREGVKFEEVGSRQGEAEETSQESRSVVQHNQTNLEFLKEHGSSVSAQAVEVRGWDPKQKGEFLETIKEHAQVASGQDLENFARGVLLKDENIDFVAIGEEGVQITYRMPAKFFGVLSTTLPAQAQVTFGDGERGRVPEGVSVRFPWYRFLFGVSEEVQAGSLEESLASELEGVGEITESNEPQKLAQVLQTLSNVLKTKHDTVKNSIGNIR